MSYNVIQMQIQLLNSKTLLMIALIIEKNKDMDIVSSSEFSIMKLCNYAPE